MKIRDSLSLLLLLILLLISACSTQPVQPPAGLPPAGPPAGAEPPGVASAPDADKDLDRDPTGIISEEGEEENAEEEFSLPTNPNAHPELVIPGAPTTDPLPADASSPSAPGDFVLYRNTTLLAANFPNTWLVAEPSIAPNGRMIWTTGNKYDGVSGDYGQNFTFINPFTIWSPPSPSTQFCCDQVAVHDRTHNMTIWLQQYHSQVPLTSGPNVIRLAVAHGQKELNDGSWKTYDIHPQDLTEFSGSQNWWWDYPDMALSDNYLYITINPNNYDGLAQRAVIFRLSLATLAAGSALPNPWPYYVTPTDVGGFLRPTQGATTTMYFGQNVDNSTVRLYTWPELLIAPLYTDISVDGWYNSAAHTYCSDGSNFMAYGLYPVQAAWVAKGYIGMMWNSAEGGSFPYPHVRWVRIKVSDFSVNDQGQIWSSDFAWGFPSVSVNDRGDIAGTIASGCGLAVARTVQLRAWIADSYNANTITSAGSGLTNIFIATGTNGASRWGDYYTTRRDTPYGNTWWGTGTVLQGGPDSADTNVHLAWFGRAVDYPPATHTIYGDAGSGAYQDGTNAHGFKKAEDSCYAALPGDTVILHAGTYTEPGVTLNRACFIDATGGSAIIK